MSSIGQGFAETFTPASNALLAWAAQREGRREFDAGLPLQQQSLEINQQNANTNQSSAEAQAAYQAQSIAADAQRLGENRRQFDLKAQAEKDAADPKIAAEKLIAYIDFLTAHYRSQGVSEGEAKIRATAEAPAALAQQEQQQMAAAVRSRTGAFGGMSNVPFMLQNAKSLGLVGTGIGTNPIEQGMAQFQPMQLLHSTLPAPQSSLLDALMAGNGITDPAVASMLAQQMQAFSPLNQPAQGN